MNGEQLLNDVLAYELTAIHGNTFTSVGFEKRRINLVYLSSAACPTPGEDGGEVIPIGLSKRHGGRMIEFVSLEEPPLAESHNEVYTAACVANVVI